MIDMLTVFLFGTGALFAALCGLGFAGGAGAGFIAE